MGDVAQILGGAQLGQNGNETNDRISEIMQRGKQGQHEMVMIVPTATSAPASSATVTASAKAVVTASGSANANGQDHATDTGAAQNGASEVVVKIGNRSISSAKKARKWAWAKFASSARTDGTMFSHWVRAGIEYTDYPYAKFDIHLDPVAYTDQQYAKFLASDAWTKSETDKLMELCRRYELRWAVVHDRWMEHYSLDKSPQLLAQRKLEELQYRYYSVAAILSQTHISEEAAAEARALIKISSGMPPDADKDKADKILMETAAARAMASMKPNQQPLINTVGTGSSNKLFDINREYKRRRHLEQLWQRSKEDEAEELKLRAELRLVEAQLRKLKKNGGHVMAANKRQKTGASATQASAAAAGAATGATAGMPAQAAQLLSLKSGSSMVEDNSAFLDGCFSSTAPTAMPGNPYLQSGRLMPPATGGSVGLNKALLLRMDTILSELKIPKRPLPTKRVCDVYDSVRKDVLKLLTLQKVVLQKEGALQGRRSKVTKLFGGGGGVTEEKALLGISPIASPPAPAPTTTNSAAGTTTGRGKTGRATKSKAGGVGGKGKSQSKKAAAADASGGVGETTTTPKKKAATKRKRKSDAKTGAAGAATSSRVVSSTSATVKAGSAAGKTAAKSAASKTAVVTTAPTAAAPAAATKTAGDKATSTTKAAPTAAPGAAATATTAVPATKATAEGTKGSAKKRAKKA